MHKIIQFLGAREYTTSHREKLISLAGGVLGVYAIYLVSIGLFGFEEAVYIIPSMGASAVLLFAAPHAPFSQPWNVFGGHIISAFIGVACFQFIPNLHTAAALSVGIAIGAMYYTRCIHPPGGATALAAVIGSEQIHALGFAYILTPVLINTLSLLLIAVIFNLLFPWRRYPVSWFNSKKSREAAGIRHQQDIYKNINHEDFVYALSQIDTFVDISEADLLRIYSLATGRKHAHLGDSLTGPTENNRQN